MFRQLRADAREFPATMILSALWIVVFALMVGLQAFSGRGVTAGQLVLGLREGSWFGDMTVGELYAGELWRTLTATFVHYGLLHIGLNLYAFYQLGCLIESWYGSCQFVAIYVLMGGGGNLLSGLLRHAMKFDPMIASGGGSVVVMGLVGLCAVVGWRARTRLGDYLRDQMFWVLGLTAAIGLILPVFGLPIIDNWGHACGAAVGAAIGLGNRRLVRQVGSSPARWAGWVGALLITASALAQVADDRKAVVTNRQQASDARQLWVDSERWLNRLDQVRQLYQVVVVAGNHVIPRGAFVQALPVRSATVASGPAPGPAGSDPEQALYLGVLNASLAALDSMSKPLDTGATASDFRRVRELLARSLTDMPSFEEAGEIDSRLANLSDNVRRQRDAARLKALTSLQRGRAR
jgi:membrane associated rhomboid family serine protease